MDQVKRWEDSELSNFGVEDKPLIVQKKLAPLNEGGPMQLLKAQIDQLEEENKLLRKRLKDLEETALTAINEKEAIKEKLSAAIPAVEPPKDSDDKVDAKEVEELAEAFKAVKHQMATELEMNAKTQKELETDLTSTKHQLLDIQHQLNMAEKVGQIIFYQ